MSLKLSVKSSVSTQTYNFEKENSRSYITDEISHYEYQLDGIASDLWHVILHTQNYNTVYEYAQKHNLLNELEEFLLELEKTNIIEIKGISESKATKNNKIKPISGLQEKEEKFEEEQYKWLIANGFLQNLTLQLSYKCNLKCTHCFNEKCYPDAELHFEDIKSIIDEAYKLGVTAVGITGGECTCHKDFLKIVKYIRDKHLAVRVLTNGQLLYDNDFFEEFVSLNPNMVKLSLYSMNPETHDKMTGIKGSQHKTKEVIRKLAERKIMTNISFLVTKENKNDYIDVLNFGDSIGAWTSVSTYYVNNPRNNNSHLMISEDELTELYLQKEFPASPHNTEERNHVKKKTICHGAYRTIAVAPNLNVLPCNDFEYVLGNLKTESLEDIWKKKAKEFRKIFCWENIPDCNNDDYCKYCGYCPTPAFLQTKELKKSEICCENARAYQKALLQIKNEYAIQ